MRKVWSEPPLRLGLCGAGLFVAGLIWDVTLHAYSWEPAIGQGTFSAIDLRHLPLTIGLVLLFAGAVSYRRGGDRRVSVHPGARRLPRSEPIVRLVCLGGLIALATSGDAPGSAVVHGRESSLGVDHIAPMAEAPPHARGSSDLVWDHDEASHLLHLRSTALMVSDEQQAAAAALVRETVTQAQRFADVEAARAAGYAELGGDLTANHGFVYLYDRTFVREGAQLNPNRPQALGYLRRPDGERLLSVTYVAPLGTGLPVGGGLTIWQPLGRLCLDERQMLVAIADRAGGCPADTASVTGAYELLRVWLFDHPRGAFAGRLAPEDLPAPLQLER